MCGRYSQTREASELEKRFRLDRVETPVRWRYNVAPSQEMPIVVLRDGTRVLTGMRWGLVPSWAKDPSPGPINARAETLAVKPMFRNLLKSRRCLVPACGFYEWARVSGAKTKQPYRFVLKGSGLFAFAGLWDFWKGPNGTELRTFAIVTTTPNEVVRPVHDRMPVILGGEDVEQCWLTGTPQDAGEVLKPAPDDTIRAYPTSTLVNSPGNDVPECASPLPRQGEVHVPPDAR